MFGLRLGKMGSVGGKRTLRSLLSKWGSNAHAYLPGAGTISGLPTENYTSSTGDTGYSAVDGVVGLVLDGMGVVGAELKSSGAIGITGTATAATYNTTSGVGVVTRVDASNQSFVQWSGLSSSTYKVTVSCDSGVAIGVRSGTSSGAILATVFPGAPVTVYVVPGSNSLTLTSSSGTSTFTVSTVKEISGIHASNPTTANKPLLLRGARNLLLNSVLAGGTSGAWGSSAVAPTNWAVGSGTGSVAFASNTAQFVATAQRPFIGETVTLPVGTYIHSVQVTAGSHTALAALIGTAAVSAVLSATTYKKNNVTATGAESVTVGDVISAAFSVTTAGTVTLRIGLGCAGAATGDITLTQPQLETGSTASAYSPTTTAAASNPLAGAYSWAFDGSNDNLSSAAFSAGTLTSSMDCYVVVNRATSAQGILIASGNSGGFIGCYVDGQGSATSSLLSCPIRVDGVACTDTRAALSAALSVGVTHIYEAYGVNLSSWTGFGISVYGNPFIINGNVYAVILTPAASDADRTEIRKQLASLYGVTLA